MKVFLIQTIEGQVVHDFSFQLIEAIRYHNWYSNEQTYRFILSETVKELDAIPIGSLEFVFDYMNLNLNIPKEKIKPINVPIQLTNKSYTQRNCSVLKSTDLVFFKHPLFIKSATQYKTFTEIVDSNDNIPNDLYFVSEVIEIESEWRGFVFNGELVGLQNYTGDFTLFPDVMIIRAMISAYTSSPLAYTLDVGINKIGTFIIEVHPFVSCGLYGFRENRVLPQMFINGFKSLVHQAKK